MAKAATATRKRQRRAPEVSRRDHTYDRKREASATREKEKSRKGRDVGQCHPEDYVGRCACQECGGPKCRRPARKKRAAASLRKFCEEYFPLRFKKAWSPDHLKVIAKLEKAIRNGGLFALAMPRGSGKSTLIEVAVLWAILYGHRRYVVVIGSTETAATKILCNIVLELETNELLHEDFPLATYPIRCVEGIAQRCRGQLFNGHRTRLALKDNVLVMPDVEGSEASAAVVNVAGLTGNIRGMKHGRPDGEIVRPDFVIVDDPQTDESAKSPAQVEDREKLLAGAVLGLAGPGEKIAGVMTCTVIQTDDVADRVLDRKKHPQWQGERMKLVYKWPTSKESERLLDKYAELAAEDWASAGVLSKATAFYKRHRKKIEAGAACGWKQRYESDECSAFQHAYNQKLKNPATFDAEFQNEPIDASADVELLTAEEIAAKVNGYKRGEVPQEATRVTAFIDVQGNMLFWMVVAWCDDFTGFVLAYGAWPDQGAFYFTKAGARQTFKRKYKGRQEAQITAGLQECVDWLFDQTWKRDDGAELPIELLLIDAQWKKEVVYNFCRQHPQRARILPRHGRGVKAAQAPMDQWKKTSGERVGLNWRLRRKTENHPGVRHVIFDTNFWKSFVHTRLSTATGDRGCLSLYKPRRKGEHQIVGDHCRAEIRKCMTSDNRKCDEWLEKPNKPDNDFFDCLVGAAVAAAIQGCALAEHKAAAPRKKIKLSELQRQRRAARG